MMDTFTESCHVVDPVVIKCRTRTILKEMIENILKIFSEKGKKKPASSSSVITCKLGLS